MKLLIKRLVLILAVITLAACGMQGDLYLPTEETESPAKKI